MMDEGQARDGTTLEAKPNKDDLGKVLIPADKEAFNKHMMSQRKFHAEALRDIENYLFTEGLITRRIAIEGRDR